MSFSTKNSAGPSACSVAFKVSVTQNAHCVILFVCLLSICNSYYYMYKATSFGGVFLLVAFHYIALVCNYCFFIVVNKISIYLSTCRPMHL